MIPVLSLKLSVAVSYHPGRARPPQQHIDSKVYRIFVCTPTSLDLMQ